MSCVKQNLIKLHVVRFILFQSSLVVESCFFSNSRVSSRFDVVYASSTSHLHVPKLFLLSNFTTSILNGCGFMDFPIDVLLPAIFLTDSSNNAETNRVRSNKLDKDRIFTSERNPRGVSKTIYSCELIPRAIQTLFLDRHTISAKQPPMPLELTHDPTTNLGCSDTTC